MGIIPWSTPTDIQDVSIKKNTLGEKDLFCTHQEGESTSCNKEKDYPGKYTRVNERRYGHFLCTYIYYFI
jgi:hypothetical protein